MNQLNLLFPQKRHEAAETADVTQLSGVQAGDRDPGLAKTLLHGIAVEWLDGADLQLHLSLVDRSSELQDEGVSGQRVDQPEKTDRVAFWSIRRHSRHGSFSSLPLASR